MPIRPLIAIDGTSIPPRPAGAGTYILNLVRALAAVDGDHDYTVYVRHHAIAFFSGLPKSFEVADVGEQPRWRRQVWEQAVLPVSLGRKKAALLHSPHHTTPLAFTPCPRVLTVHDVTFFILPDRYPWLRRWYFQVMTALSARRADAVIVPSESVRGEALSYLRPPGRRFDVIPEGVDPAFRPLAEDPSRRLVRDRYGLPERYLLSLGTREPGKNRETIFLALRRLLDDGRDLQLVVAGQRAWGAQQEDESMRRLGLAGRVHFTGYVAQADLPAVYNGAQVFVFPSLHEGFGLPALEAMACGVPVVTSNLSSLPEVTGDTARLVDPTDPAAIAMAIATVLDDQALAEKMSAAGLERAKAFTWEACALRTAAVYRRVLGEADTRA